MYQTTPKIPIGETPFHLTFGVKEVVPVEVRVPSTQLENYDEQTNMKRLRANLDLLEEVQERAHTRMAAYQHQMAQNYNSRIKSKCFKVGDLVLRGAEVSQPGKRGKLAPNWESPYQVDEIVKLETYCLK